MREILFRGKRTNKDEWIYGSLIHRNDYCCILPEEGVLHPMNEPYLNPDLGTFDGYAIPVDNATVGQFTGLRDQNGKRIFEGDNVRYTFDSPDDPTATENGLRPRTGRIFWSEWRASFAVTAGRNGSDAINNDVARYVRGRSIYEYVQGANTVEVIGNIHDNPELLKGGGIDA